MLLESELFPIRAILSQTSNAMLVLFACFCCCWFLAQNPPTRSIHLGLFSCSKPSTYQTKLGNPVTWQYLPPLKYHLIFFFLACFIWLNWPESHAHQEGRFPLTWFNLFIIAGCVVRLRPCDPPTCNRCALPHLARSSL